MAQKYLLLLCLRLSSIYNLGLKKARLSVHGLKGSGQGVWSNGPGQKGRKGCVKGSFTRANGFFKWFVCLIGSPLCPWWHRSCLARRVNELDINWVKSVEWYCVCSNNINDHILILVSVNTQLKLPHINILETFCWSFLISNYLFIKYFYGACILCWTPWGPKCVFQEFTIKYGRHQERGHFEQGKSGKTCGGR